MKPHPTDHRQFYQLTRCWYGPTILAQQPGLLDEVMFGFYSPDGGTSGEMGVRWTEVGGRPTPQLQVFNDAWAALWELRDVLAALAQVDDQHITPEQFCELLKGCGFTDRTQTKRESD